MDQGLTYCGLPQDNEDEDHTRGTPMAGRAVGTDTDVVAYKLLRVRGDGSLGPLFVDRGLVLRPGQEYRAKTRCPHPGLAYRPGFHCTHAPRAPHIKLVLKTGERRVWCRVRLRGRVTPHRRPEAQGGLWYTAEYMTITEVLP